MALVWVALKLRECLSSAEYPEANDYQRGLLNLPTCNMDFSITDIVLLSAVLVASIVYLVYQNRTRKEQERKKQFSFMKLYVEAYLVGETSY